jgi:hypothetical protein
MTTMNVLTCWKMFAQTGSHCLAYLRSKSPTNLPDTPSTYDGVDRTLTTLEESVYWAGLKSEM